MSIGVLVDRKDVAIRLKCRGLGYGLMYALNIDGVSVMRVA
jgi:hypothetical protein